MQISNCNDQTALSAVFMAPAVLAYRRAATYDGGFFVAIQTQSMLPS